MPENTPVFLKDISERDKPWDAHRRNAETVQGFYGMDRSGEFERLAQRMGDCSKLLELALRDGEDGEQHFKLAHARFCRVRHCPVCQWRRSLMWVARTKKALPRILNDYPNHRWIFLTLTVRNPLIQDLRDSIQSMNKAFVKLTKRKVWPGVGWLKSLEVTCPKDIDYAHPHFHVLVMVPNSYFQGKYYLSQEKWVDLWSSCLGVDYSPVVDVRAVKPMKGDLKQGVEKAIAETFKYSVKEADLVLDAQWLLELTAQMHNARSVGIGGCFREYFSENEPEDLINCDDLPDGEETSDAHLFFPWDPQYRRYRLIKE